MGKIITREQAIELLENKYEQLDKRTLAEIVVAYIVDYSNSGRLTNLGLTAELETEGLGQYKIVDDNQFTKLLYNSKKE